MLSPNLLPWTSCLKEEGLVSYTWTIVSMWNYFGSWSDSATRHSLFEFLKMGTEGMNFPGGISTTLSWRWSWKRRLTFTDTLQNGGLHNGRCWTQSHGRLCQATLSVHGVGRSSLTIPAEVTHYHKTFTLCSGLVLTRAFLKVAEATLVPWKDILPFLFLVTCNADEVAGGEAVRIILEVPWTYVLAVPPVGSTTNLPFSWARSLFIGKGIQNFTFIPISGKTGIKPVENLPAPQRMWRAVPTHSQYQYLCSK